MSEWQQNTSYGASSMEPGCSTKLWFGPVEAMRNGSFISLRFTYPGDSRPRTLLLRASELAFVIDADHGTHAALHGETYRAVEYVGARRYL